MAGVATGGPLVGRAEHLDVLRRHLGQARTGEPQLVLIVGDPGVGKTRLVSEVTGDADGGVLVLAAPCLELSGAAVPLAPAQTLVHRALRRLGADTVAQAAGPYLPILAMLEPALTPGHDVSAEGKLTDQRQLFAGLRHLLEQLAEPDPLIVVVEDVQWADDATLDLLRYLMLSIQDSALLILATARSGRVADRLLSALGRLSNVTTVHLGELQTDDARQLAEELSRAVVTDADIHDQTDLERLVKRSGGNPLYLEELVSAHDSGELPPSLRVLLLDRLQALPADARGLVEVVAVGDPPVSYEDLLDTTSWSEQQLDTALGRAEAAGVLALTSTRRVGFRHPLLGDAARDALNPGRRRELHRAWATSLTDAAGSGRQTAAAVAFHWHQAGEPQPALQAAWDGAHTAAALHAHAVRATLLDRVAGLWSHTDTTDIPADQVDVLTEAARSHELAGSFDLAADRLDKALETLEPGTTPCREATLMIDRARIEVVWQDQSPEPWLQRAADVLPDLGCEHARGRLLAAQADRLVLTERRDEVPAIAHEAVQLARMAGDLATEVRALRHLAAFEDIDTPAKAVARYRTLVDRADDAGMYDVMLNAMITLLSLEEVLLRGGIQAARRDCDAFISTAHRRGLDSHASVATLHVIDSYLRLTQGDLDEADAAAHRAWTVFGDHADNNFGTSVRATVRLIRGDVDGARRQLQGLVRSSSEFQADAAADPQAWLLWLDNGPQAAIEALLPALQRQLNGQPEHKLPWVPEQIYSLARYLRLAPKHNRSHQQGSETLRAIREVLAVTIPHDPLPDVLDATLIHLEGGDPTAHWRDAAEQGPPAAGRYWHIDTLIRLAENTPARAEALQALQDAEVEAHRMGSMAQVDEINTARKRLAGLPGPAGLTAREMEVLAHVSQGLTNGEIGARLYISPSTVGVHISSILRKTNTSGRAEAADWARAERVV